MAGESTTKGERGPAKKRKRRGVTLEPTRLTADELPIAAPSGRLKELADAVLADGGAVIGAYREPLAGRELMFVAVPIDRVEPTPFQRDVSDAHVRKLTRSMDKTRRFLDPVILVRHHERYFTPNGHHRLVAMRELGAQAVIGLLVPEPEVAYQILALNIEKAHNLRERALEVVRMYRDLALAGPERLGLRKENDFELEFDEPGLITLGFCYEQRGRFAGGAYNPILRKVDSFLDMNFEDAQRERERRAAVLLELDDAVNDCVARLKERGLTSPYLKTFVVARINPLRFMKGSVPEFDALMTTMTKRARGMRTDKIDGADLARTGGVPDDD